MPTRTQHEQRVIRASAGTGKTFALTNRYIRLLGSEADPATLDSILATTFTRKAAGEILARVISRLAEAAVDPSAAAELGRHAELGNLDPPRAGHLLALALSRLHRLRVETLDSFFIQIAQSFGLELGLPLGWEIIEEADEQRIRRDAIRRLLADQSTRDAVELMHLLSKGEARRSVGGQIDEVVGELYEVFTEAAPEAWQPVPRGKPLSPLELADALTSLAEVPIDENKRMHDARDSDLEKARAGDWAGMLGSGLTAKILDGSCAYYRKPIPAEVIEAYRPVIDHARAYLSGIIASQTDAARRLLERYDAIYHRLKWQRRGLRFTDVTRLLAQGGIEGHIDRIAYRLDAPVRHVLLDEFQDTSPPQWHVLRPFVRRVVERPERCSLFCVGDVKQAIFGWRGGMAEIFDALDDEFPTVEASSLTRSYRSSPVIIDTVNRVFSSLAQNEVAQKYPEATRAWAARFEPHETARTELPGYCRMETGPAATDDQKQRDVTLDAAAELIVSLHRRSPEHSIGVLVRKNDAVARMIYRLRAEGIMASEEGGNPLDDSPAVSLILSLLKLADHPADTVARYHLATSPLAGPLALADHTDDAAAEHAAGQLRAQLMDTGYGPSVQRWSELIAPHCKPRDRRRMKQLVELAYAYEPDATTRTDDFLRVIEQQRVEDPLAAAVRVMTLHKAKGLQFDVVVLPELDFPLLGQTPRVVIGRDGPAGPVDLICRGVNSDLLPLLPTAVADAYDTQRRRMVEETLCLLYVALTRAVHALHVIIAPSKNAKEKLHAKPSHLLRAALTDGKPLDANQVFHESGNQDWPPSAGCHACYASVSELTSMPTQAGAWHPARPTENPAHDRRGHGTLPVPEVPSTSAGLPEIVLAPCSDRPARGLRRLTPSGLEGGRCVQLSGVLRLDNQPALQRGTIIHAWFELIGWLDADGIPSDDALREAAVRAADGPLDVDVDRLIGEFHAMLARPAIAALFEKRGASPAAKSDLELCNEWPFVLREGDGILRGSIDRLVVFRDGVRPVAAEIVDFKTDRVAADDRRQLQQRVDHYRPQMAAYRRAVARHFDLPLEQVATRLAFTEPGVVVDIGV